MKYTPEQVEAFAEALSRDKDEGGELSPGACAVIAGLKAVHGLHLLNLVRRGLGKQAR